MIIARQIFFPIFGEPQGGMSWLLTPSPRLWPWPIRNLSCSYSCCSSFSIMACAVATSCCISDEHCQWQKVNFELHSADIFDQGRIQRGAEGAEAPPPPRQSAPRHWRFKKNLKMKLIPPWHQSVVDRQPSHSWNVTRQRSARSCYSCRLHT